MYAGGFLVTDILSENYGKKEAKKAVVIGFVSMVATALSMKIAVSFTPSSIDGQTNFASLKTIFDFMPRILLAGFAAYGVPQLHDIWAYKFWKKLFPSRIYIRMR